MRQAPALSSLSVELGTVPAWHWKTALLLFPSCPRVSLTYLLFFLSFPLSPSFLPSIYHLLSTYYVYSTVSEAGVEIGGQVQEPLAFGQDMGLRLSMAAHHWCDLG